MAESVVRAEWLFVCCAVFAAAFVDLKTRTIPNACVLSIVASHVAALVSLCLGGYDAGTLVAASFAGAFAVGAPLALAAHLTDGIGGGDVKLLSALGLCLGWQRGMALLALSCALTACVGFVAFIVRRRHRPETRLRFVTVPMAPQIAGALLAILYISQL